MYIYIYIYKGLIDRKEQQQLGKRRTKEENELVARLRLFARFHSAADHEVIYIYIYISLYIYVYTYVY
jgi:hypothetical protein